MLFLIVFYKFFDLIRRKHIKQKDIIKDIGISSATLANMKANKGISTETLSKLCTYLKCKPQDIIEFQEEESC